MNLEEIVRPFALKNAVDHGGRALPKAVLGMVLGRYPELRRKVKEVKEVVENVVEEINKLSLEEQMAELKKYKLPEEKKEERREELPPLPQAEEGKVVLRFAPEPGGYIHLGNLRAALVNYLYAEKYKGTFLLRFDDTNPKKAKIPYYDAIIEDLTKIGMKWDKIVYQSDRFELYYKYGRKLLETGHAYATFEKDLPSYRRRGLPIPGRERSVEENLEIFEKMLEGEYEEGEVAILLKSDPRHPNPVLRDPTLFRVIDTVPHPRKGWKYIVYPTYNFASAIDDATLGITHILRGKDHENNGKIQRMIQEFLGLNTPVTIAFGRMKIEGETALPLGKRYIRQAFREGAIESWGDVKVPTVRSLLERGIQPKALIEFYKGIGAKKTDISVSMESIYAINRKLLDPKARRFHFVPDPVEVVVEGAPAIETKIPYHPDRKELGERVYRFKEGTHHLFISRADLPREGEKVRLKHLYNIVIREVGESVVAEFAGTEIGKEKKIQWVPKIGEHPILAEIIHPSGKNIVGYIEHWAQTLKDGEIVQLERVCFARVKSNQGEKIFFYWTHR